MKNTIKSWLNQAKTEIGSLDAELILLAGMMDSLPKNADRSYLVAHSEREITPQGLRKLNEMLERRRSAEPLAYILGRKEFYGREFAVNPAVLIPRPETEALIDLVKTLKLPQKPRFCEVGTGSGCIAITLALEYPQAEVLAVDVSRQALEVAAQNNREYEGRVKLIESDLLAGLLAGLSSGEFSEKCGERVEKSSEQMEESSERLENSDEKSNHFDVLVANLPYVDRNWRWLDRHALSFEPEEALYAEEKGLELYRRLLEEIRERCLRRSCRIDYLVFEADPVQHEALIKMAEEIGFSLKEVQGFGMLFGCKIRHEVMNLG